MLELLEETPMGNIVRGWEQSRVFSSRSRRVADKERLFSHSSYAVWLESRSRPPSSEETKEDSVGFVKNKRVRRGVQRRERDAPGQGYCSDWGHRCGVEFISHVSGVVPQGYCNEAEVCRGRVNRKTSGIV